MAEAFLRQLAGDRFDVASAGTEASGVHPLARRVMEDIRVDIGGLTSKTLNHFRGQSWDYAITLCEEAKERCPTLTGGAQSLLWSFPDPARAATSEALQLAAFRSVRDHIRERIEEWLVSLDLYRTQRPRRQPPAYLPSLLLLLAVGSVTWAFLGLAEALAVCTLIAAMGLLLRFLWR